MVQDFRDFRVESSFESVSLQPRPGGQWPPRPPGLTNRSPSVSSNFVKILHVHRARVLQYNTFNHNPEGSGLNNNVDYVENWVGSRVVDT